jgi:hypothetical protein
MLRPQSQEPAQVARRRPLVYSTAPCRLQARAGARGRSCQASSRRRDRRRACTRSGARERCPNADLPWNAALSCDDATAASRPSHRAISKTCEPPPHAQAASASNRDRLGGRWLSTTNLMRPARPHDWSATPRTRSRQAHHHAQAQGSRPRSPRRSRHGTAARVGRKRACGSRGCRGDHHTCRARW